MREKFLMVLSYTAFIVRECWVFVAHRKEIISPFPYSNQDIAFQTHRSMALTYLFAALIAIVIALKNSNVHRFYWNALLVIAGMEFIEFFLNYNEPWTHFYLWGLKVAVNVTNFRYFALGIIMFYELIAWNNFRNILRYH